MARTRWQGVIARSTSAVLLHVVRWRPCVAYDVRGVVSQTVPCLGMVWDTRRVSQTVPGHFRARFCTVRLCPVLFPLRHGVGQVRFRTQQGDPVEREGGLVVKLSATRPSPQPRMVSWTDNPITNRTTQPPKDKK
ncbi:hypothetical protein Bbelb_115890 [Branchiostoma belcheri]|nr:hypothetical protein Bbelb_115890 [Branchiostoma belcheri]